MSLFHHEREPFTHGHVLLRPRAELSSGDFYMLTTRRRELARSNPKVRPRVLVDHERLTGTALSFLRLVVLVL